MPPIQYLFVENLGKELSATEIRKPFDVAFGVVSGKKVQVKCRKDIDENQQMITEVWINIEGEIESYPSINELLKKSPNARLGSCKGEIDPAFVNES